MSEELNPEQLKGLFAILGAVTSGFIARQLIHGEQIDWRKFWGEWILALLGGMALWAAGVLQHLAFIEMVLVGTAAGLGGVRAMEWLIKLIAHIKRLH
ncbi:hypothetical protein NFHSH190041_36930 (plasmid) [Shewanella sp. NFH-SH190041]|uniref:hypothetical protein n=1 Tax=Shewanella sp. NFH-SH190041 TaxID=2950245 RepID=UPI0021C4803C|nr:hypothetical protein [Shewanella sp. NFH-SH190041]BDM66241.1 hypothetical protein NFHSH190041_36930 [Shewanella sp. NFH-SH190041]